MPKSTFYRISEDKQKRILDSAINEFMSVPYSDVSINKIIKEAEIPRGSFYQYFDGKEDLFLFVLQEQKHNMFEMVMEQMEKYEGDVFACINNNIDEIIEFACHNDNGKLRMLFSEPWVFENIWKSDSKEDDCEAKVLASLVEKIDINILEVENEEELLNLISILLIIVRDSICKLFLFDSMPDEDEAKARFHAKIRTLQKHYCKQMK